MLRKALRTLLTLDDTPERTALAFAVGIFWGFCPLVGLHTVLGLASAVYFRLNKVAVMIGVYANTPWTLVPFYAFATWFGIQITGMDGIDLPADIGLSEIFSREFLIWLTTQWRLLIPAFIGSLVISILLSLVSYPLSLRLIRRFRSRRTAAVEG